MFMLLICNKKDRHYTKLQNKMLIFYKNC